jgi:hypothetical protein
VASFTDWKYSVDRQATVAAYQLAERGGCDTCDCIYCRNFRLARKHVFPPEFLTLLEQLGIDPWKEGEAYHNARLAPGRHHYGGWFHFVGSLDAKADSPYVILPDGFESWIQAESAPCLASLKGLPLVEVDFLCDAVPWLLDEPEQS